MEIIDLENNNILDEKQKNLIRKKRKRQRNKKREINKRKEKIINSFIEKHEFSYPFIERAIYNRDEKLLDLTGSFFKDEKEKLLSKIKSFDYTTNSDWDTKDISIEKSVYQYQLKILEKEEEEIKKNFKLD